MSNSSTSAVFYVKYFGSVGFGWHLGTAHNCKFVIRTPDDYWQFYEYAGAGPGFGFPFSLGTRLEPGEGWARLVTAARPVDELGGIASVESAGVTGLTGVLSYFRLQMPTDERIVLRTGWHGIDYSVGQSFGPLWPDGPLNHNREWRDI